MCRGAEEGYAYDACECLCHKVGAKDKALEARLVALETRVASITPLTNGDLRLVRDLVLRNSQLEREVREVRAQIESANCATHEEKLTL